MGLLGSAQRREQFVAMTSGTAWSTAATRRAWGVAGVWGLAWFVAGSLLLVAFMIYASTVQGGAEHLRATGVRTTAVALADPPESLRCGQVPVPIRYAVAGVTHTEQLFIDGCGPAVQAGDEFTIYVDAATPSRFVADFSENESPIAVLAAIGALLAGLFLVASAAVRAYRLLRVLPTLRSGSWTQQSCRIVSVPGKLVRSNRIVALGNQGEAVLIKLPFTAGDNASFRPGGSVTIFAACGHSGHWALSKDVSTRPVAGKEVDGARLRARALERLGDPIVR